MTPNRRNLFGIFFVLLIVTALPVVLFLTKQRQDIRPRALSGGVNLLLSASSLASQVGQSTEVVVQAQITDPAVRISGADIMLLYDKTKLNVTSIIPQITENDPKAQFTDSPYFTSGGNFDSTFNFLRVVVVARKPDSELPGGTVALAKIIFSSIGEGAGVIKFPDDNSYLQVVGTSIPNNGPTPTPGPSDTPTPTPSTILPNCKNLTGSTTIVRGNSYTYAVTSDNLSGVGKVDNLGLAITRNNCAASSDTLYWTDRWITSGLGTVANTTYSFTINGTKTATLPLGQYSLDCRAWNDSISECRGACYSTGAPLYQCSGPDTSLTVSVVDPTITPSPTTRP